MSGDSAIRSMLALCTAVLMAVALYLGRSIFAPVALSLFGLACVWPFQRALQSKVPKLIALVFTLLLTLVVLGVLGLAVAWGSGQVGHLLLGNVERFQFIYMTSNAWLEERGIFLTGMLAERFDVSWLVAYVQQVAARLNSMVGFVRLCVHDAWAYGGGPCRLANRETREPAREPEVVSSHSENCGSVSKVHPHPQPGEYPDRFRDILLRIFRRAGPGGCMGGDNFCAELYS